MWLQKFKRILIDIFFPKSISQAEVQDEVQNVAEETHENDERKIDFKLNNIIFDKLNHLEQYIKIFSQTFPKQYSEYLIAVQSLRTEYERELEKYKKGFDGNITFAIDPEHESRRHIAVISLENEIKKFVENEVGFKVSKDKFSKLCGRLNTFYNALFRTQIDISVILNQINNAKNSLNKIVNEAKEQEFFNKDTRKKEEILNYIVYCEYLIFKSLLRCSNVKKFDEYKNNISQNYDLFVHEEYERLIFNFLIEDLEDLQIYINNNFKNESTYQYISKNCQMLQNELDEYNKVFNDDNYFASVIKFENTVDNLAESSDIKFEMNVPRTIHLNDNDEEVVSVIDMALSILSLIDNNKSKLVYAIIKNFKQEISWREFFFLTKIFELYSDVIETATNTIFNVISEKFLKLDNKYEEYTDSYIQKEKDKILNYSGSKSKKYIHLLYIDKEFLPAAAEVLNELFLDFVIKGNDVYLNHSYFNGFKNLEENFGEYITF